MFKIFKNIITQVSAVVGGVIIIITSFAGGYSFITKKAITRDKEKSAIVIMDKKVDRLIENDSVRLVTYKDLSDSIRALSRKLQIYVNKQNAVNISYVDHLKLENKMDQLIKYYELQNGKKSIDFPGVSVRIEKLKK